MPEPPSAATEHDQSAEDRMENGVLKESQNEHDHGAEGVVDKEANASPPSPRKVHGIAV